jgi:hypothetical protein
MDNMRQRPETLTAELSRKLENRKRLSYYLALFFLVVGCVGVVLAERAVLPVEKVRMVSTSLGIGVLLVALFGYLIVSFLRGYVTTVRAIVPTLLTGGIGLLLCSWFSFFYFNWSLDRSEFQTHEVNFLLKHSPEGRKPIFLVAVSSWKSKKNVVVFPVTQQEYVKTIGPRCRITTRAGRFGFEWIVSSECGQDNLSAKSK